MLKKLFCASPSNAVGLVAIAAALLGATACRDDQRGAKTEPPRQTADSAAATVASSGRILGVAIGDTMEAAREKLDPLRAPGSYPPDEKELQGRRIYWKLAGTEYDWIMVWADKQGKITRVRAVSRPEHQKSFGEIGDLSTAITADAQTVRWNLKTAAGSPYRLVAQGAGERAASVYMFSQEISPADQQAAESDLEEK